MYGAPSTYFSDSASEKQTDAKGNFPFLELQAGEVHNFAHTLNIIVLCIISENSK